MIRRRTAAVAALMLGTAFGPALQASADASRSGTGHSERAVCGQAASGQARCFVHVVTRADGVTPAATASYAGGYGPADLRAAYSIPATGTGGGTIAIVDAYASPNAAADLAAYRTQFYGSATTFTPPGSATTQAFGVLTQVEQNGTPMPATGLGSDTGWGTEEMLDLEMATAVCPQCDILYVGANSASYSDLGTAVNYAAQQSPRAISNSYGGNEYSSESEAAYNHPGIAITVSSGDNGYGSQFPAASQYVIAVGGTSLTLNPEHTARSSETAWSGGGSGCSTYIPRPSWQLTTVTGCSRRMIADVAADADPNTGVAVYDTYTSTPSTPWAVYGGTSVASPIVGSLYALEGVSASYPYPANGLYTGTTSPNLNLYDVVSGSNGHHCKPTYWCNARSGYDGPTGNGTPLAQSVF